MQVHSRNRQTFWSRMSKETPQTVSANMPVLLELFDIYKDIHALMSHMMWVRVQILYSYQGSPMKYHLNTLASTWRVN